LKKRSRREYTFERRIRKFLEKKGYLVVKCGASRPFDIVAIKAKKGIPIEVKAKKTPYPEAQQMMQRNLALRTWNHFMVVRQAETRGKILVATSFHGGKLFWNENKYPFRLPMPIPELKELM